MRLPLLLLAPLTALLALGAVAQWEAGGTRVELRTAGYVDDDDTLVVRPYVAGRLAIDDARVGLAYSPDVISTASVDIVSAASQRVDEVRHQGVADVAYVGDRGLVLGASYSAGVEPDHQSHGGRARVAGDLDDARLWTGALSLSVTWAQISSVVDPRLGAESISADLALSLARIFDASSVGRLSLEAGVVSGFQASAYRTVRLGDWQARRSDGHDPEVPIWSFTGVAGVVREHHPELRLRARLGVDGARDLGHHVAILGRLGGYGDDWGILAGDLQAELRFEPEPGLVARVGARAYLQSGASFWQRRYPSNEEPLFATGDRELGPMRSYTVLLGISIPVDEVQLDARVEGIRFEYPEFDLLPERHALSMILGCTWTPDASL